MPVPIHKLAPGTRFRTESYVGTLLYVNQCRAKVQLDLPPVEKHVTDRMTGNVKTFFSKSKDAVQNWSPNAEVEPIREEA